MRFLLKATEKVSRAAHLESTVFAAKLSAPHVTTDLTPKSDTSTNTTWGQQCSPHCGCVVRFEAEINVEEQTVVNATYHAKRVVAVEKNGRLEPVLTTRTNKPMFEECKCKTVHELSKAITSNIKNKDLKRLKNTTEFSFTRSSPAFQHAVLANLELPRTDTGCFDVVEEAYTAMVKGFLPGRRRRNRNFAKLLSTSFVENKGSADEDEIFLPATRKSGGKLSVSMSSPRMMSTLSMFDAEAESWENDFYHQQNEPHNERRTNDWLTFVDEQTWQEETA